MEVGPKKVRRTYTSNVDSCFCCDQMKIIVVGILDIRLYCRIIWQKIEGENEPQWKLDKLYVYIYILLYIIYSIYSYSWKIHSHFFGYIRCSETKDDFNLFQPGKPETWKFRKNAWGISQGLQTSHWNLNNKTCFRSLLQEKKWKSHRDQSMPQCLWVLDFFYLRSVSFRSLIWSIFAKNSKITPSNLGFMTYSKNFWTLKKLSQPIYLIS